MLEDAYFFRRWSAALERDPFHNPKFRSEGGGSSFTSAAGLL